MNLFKIAARVAAVSRSPRRVSADMTAQYTGKLTTYDKMDDPSGLGPLEGYEWQEHLDANENNAVVLQAHASGPPMAIWNIPGMGGIFFAPLPLEDPNDAEQVDSRDAGDWMEAILA